MCYVWSTFIYGDDTWTIIQCVMCGLYSFMGRHVDSNTMCGLYSFMGRHVDSNTMCYVWSTLIYGTTRGQ